MPINVRARPVTRRASPAAALGYGAAALVTAVALSLLTTLARGPSFVDRLSIVNPSDYSVSVHVRGGEGDGWVPLGHADRARTTLVNEVLDQGARWTFRFRSQGRAGGQLTLSRSMLEADGWRLTVPAETAETLRNAGAPPSP